MASPTKITRWHHPQRNSIEKSWRTYRKFRQRICSYSTRLQKEYFEDEGDYESAKGLYILSDELRSSLKDSAIIMPPLPRLEEIPYVVDADPRSRYFNQVKNGLYVRMVLLDTIFNG